MFRRLVGDFREMFHEQVEFRELLWQIVRRDLLIRYKQSVMGFGWAIFMPLVNTVIFSVVFMRVAPLDVGMPYPLFAFSGLMAWNLFASALRFATTSLTSNGSLVTKVYFPREIFPFSSVIVATVDSAVAAIMLAVFMIYYGVPITPAILFLPVVILVQVAFTTGVAVLPLDGQPLLPRREVSVRGRHHGVDVRDLGALSGRERRRLGWARSCG